MTSFEDIVNQYEQNPDKGDPELLAAHKHSIRNKAEIVASESCGCFSCLKIFDHTHIEWWCEEKSESEGDGERFTAFCPYCSIDAVIGAKSGYPITTEFLERMQEQWFYSEFKSRKA